MNKTLLICAAVLTASLGAGAATPLWLRDVKIAPDGSRIAFTYKGDIYTVPVTGGRATRLTTQPSYETSPIWSPDSRSIAFASDRNGNFDIYTMPSDGGRAIRLTTNSVREIPEAFTPDGTAVLYSASIQDPAASALFPSGRLTELYSVPATGGHSTQLLATPAQSLTFMPDGKSFIYQDLKGMEDEWRKHHTSSVTRDLWLYDAASGRHTNLTARPGEDRDPVVSADGKTLYYLAERDGGTFNVYRAPVDNASGAAVALTHLTTHPVRFLSRSADGMLAFGYNGEIYTMREGAGPVKVNIDIVDDDPNVIENISVKPSWGIPSPDGKQVAFTARGDIFVTATDYPTTRRITDTPAAEQHVTWGKDGRTLYYTSERDGHYNIYMASIRRDADPNFANATIIDEKPVIACDDVERTYPQLSPDGKQLAFIQDRNKLMVMDIASGAVRQLTDGSTKQRREGGFSYEWSPDSRWIVMEVLDNMHDPYADIALLNVADGTYTNLTRSGYSDEAPRFSPDGRSITFLSERFGMRNHASWGSQMDVMAIFLSRDALDRYRLSKEDYDMLKDAEKNAKKTGSDDKDKKKDKKKKKSDKDTADDTADDEPMLVELDGICDRLVRLTPYSSDISDAIITGDGETLYYTSAVTDGYDIYKMDLREGDISVADKLNAGTPVALAPDAKCDNLFIVGNNILKKLELKNDKVTAVTHQAKMPLDRAAEREAMFNHVYISEREQFYTPDMHGVDWDAMTSDYRRFLPHINNNYDFAEMLSELLGELNVSHTGGRYYSPGSSNVTGRLGLIYDMTYDGDGLKVAEIIKSGPFDKAASSIAPGCVITAINGTRLDAGTDFDALLNNTAGHRTLVTYTSADGKTVDEAILPITVSAEDALLYDRWVKARAADVDRWSNGRLGYVHIASMADDSFRPLYSDVLGKYNDREGIVIDIRWNGGGRMHEDIEVMFSGEKYLTQEVRGVETCDMPSRRWNKPSIMLMCEACYSNAHGTPWVYKHRKLGKLVGAPVPGTMTSVNWVTMQDPSMIFGIPVIGYRTAEGTFLENSQLEPDVPVLNAPETIVTGEDTQLRTAVETLLHDIDTAKR